MQVMFETLGTVGCERDEGCRIFTPYSYESVRLRLFRNT